MTKFRSLLLASLLGGLAIHGALVACSGSGLAGAQTTTCQQWAVIEMGTNGLAAGPTLTTSVGPLQTFAAPAGWEPFGATGSGFDFRKCMP